MPYFHGMPGHPTANKLLSHAETHQKCKYLVDFQYCWHAKNTHGASMSSSTKNKRLALLSLRNSGERIRRNSSLSTSFRSELAMTKSCARGSRIYPSESRFVCVRGFPELNLR